MYTVKLGNDSDRSENICEEIIERQQKLIRYAEEDPAFEFDARLVDDRLYFVTKNKAEIDTRDVCTEVQCENAAEGIKKIVYEVLGDGVRSFVVAPVLQTPVLQEEKLSGVNIV